MAQFRMEFKYRRRFVYWIDYMPHYIGCDDKVLITVENDWSQVFYVKDFNELSGRNVLHLVDAETNEECLMWAERITNIKKVEDDPS